jgi:hypothetical protein
MLGIVTLMELATTFLQPEYPIKKIVARRKFSQISAIPPRGRQIILETGRQSQQKIQKSTVWGSNT